MPVPYSVCGKCRQAYELGEACGCAPETSEPLANEPGIGDAKVMGIDWAKPGSGGEVTVTWQRETAVIDGKVVAERLTLVDEKRSDDAPAIPAGSPVQITSFDLLPVCSTCNDTHRMTLRDQTVPCTRCPLPCQRCRRDGTGAYCTTTPCHCNCHQLGIEASGRGQRRNPHKGSRWWLDAIEALRPGDECEVRSSADATWHRAIVVHNGGAGLWVVSVLGARQHPYIEYVRCVGQTEAWT